jgi:hypothetical protein
MAAADHSYEEQAKAPSDTTPQTRHLLSPDIE